MNKRPLHKRFGERAKAGRKVTTIRDKPWAVGKPVMFYHWADKAYRSKQLDVVPVMVEETMPITITKGDGVMSYSLQEVNPGVPLWYDEGFDSQEDMDAWFLEKLLPGEHVKHVMKFRVWREWEAAA